MSGKPAPDPLHPPCMHCHSIETESHCRSRYCTWVKCRDCHRLTDTRRLQDRGNQ